jgi:hypothetical protein
LLSLTSFSLHPPFFYSFQYIAYILYLHKCYVFLYCCGSIIFFSFPFFLEFHRVGPLWQTFCVWICIWSCLFLCICLSFGSIMYERKHAVFVSELGLFQLTWCLQLHPFTFKLDVIIPMAEQNSIVFIYHIFMICSSVVGPLGCFHSLAVVNSAAMNISVQRYPDLHSFG